MISNKRIIIVLIFSSFQLYSQEIYFDYDKKSDQYEWYDDVRDHNIIEIGYSSNILYPAEVNFGNEYSGKLNKKSAIFDGEDGWIGKEVGKDRSFWIEYMDKFGFNLVDSSKSGGGTGVSQNYATGQITSYNKAVYTTLIFKKKEGLVMNRENAIKKLKEAKDLVELELMTKDEYDKLKAELTPIIKGEN